METNQTEECECGHPEEDHFGECMVDGCECEQYRPKDAQYYADLDYDARTEKWERSRE